MILKLSYIIIWQLLFVSGGTYWRIVMFDHYEWFKKEVYRLTQIDLNYYKEKQMRRRIDTLAKKMGLILMRHTLI